MFYFSLIKFRQIGYCDDILTGLKDRKESVNIGDRLCINMVSSICGKIKNNKKLVLYSLFVFIFSFGVLLLLGSYVNTWDAIWNYGFSYSIAKGQIPYRDFTMIIPPLYNFIMSIGLVLFSHDNIVFLIEQSLLVTATFCLIYKMYSERAWIFIVAMSFPAFLNFAPSYNFFLFFLTVLLLYLEKFKKNDYIIGVVLGCFLLTKYTTGFFLILPSIFMCFKDKNKLFKRLLGLLIPCLIFLLYLIITNSLYQFVDLCFLGLFDFAKSNSVVFSFKFLILLCMFLYSAFLLLKEKNNLVYWLVVLAFIIVFPNVSFSHLCTYLLFFSLLFISKNDKVSDQYFRNLSLVVVAICFLFVFVSFVKEESSTFVTYDLNNFKFYLSDYERKKNLKDANNLYSTYRKKGNTYFISSSFVWLQIIQEEKTNYFTILHYGNYGYNGTAKMIKKVKNMNDVYFIVDVAYRHQEESSKMSQFDIELVDYIIEHSRKIDSVYGYDIYYKK